MTVYSSGARSYGFLVIFVPVSDIYALQPIKFDDLTILKNCQLCNRNIFLMLNLNNFSYS